jgi:hypothetical protein
MSLNKTLIALALGLALTACVRPTDGILVCSSKDGTENFRSDPFYRSIESGGYWSMYDMSGSQIGSYKQTPGDYCRVKEVSREDQR